MLSICIPVFNFDIGQLVYALRVQIDAGAKAEIILVDDGSAENYRTINEKHIRHADKFVQLPVNIGRAAVRNRFAAMSSYDNLLFLDCDVMPSDDLFIENYLQRLDGSSILYGGRTYPSTRPPKDLQLRWHYGVSIESAPAKVRSADPYRYFQTNNFVAPKWVLQQYPFDESIQGYGYEDSMFSLTLRTNGIRILHIDNPVLNGHLVNNAEFLEQTEQAMKNLCRLTAGSKIDELVRVPRAYKRYRWMLDVIPPAVVAQLRQRLMKFPLSLKTFQLYKLLVYAQEKKRQSHP